MTAAVFAIQEYRCVYGEDVEAALRFLFNVMSPKAIEGFFFQGIPQMLYTYNGPIAKSRVFQNVMDCLGVKVVTHLPNGQEGRRVAARSKGKVERPFRTVKEAHETQTPYLINCLSNYFCSEPELQLILAETSYCWLVAINSVPVANNPGSIPGSSCK